MSGINLRSVAQKGSREEKLLAVIDRMAPDIPPSELRKVVAIHELVFKGRSLEELEHFANHGYFLHSTPEQEERLAAFIETYGGMGTV